MLALRAMAVLLGFSLCVAGCSRTNPDARSRNPAPATTVQVAAPVSSDDPGNLAQYIATHYDKREARIPMRDGTKLFTAIYTPKNARGQVPIMMVRTPYSVAPYGPKAMPRNLGPSELFTRKDWIFVKQDVRGRFMSEGTFKNMTPHIADKNGTEAVDESTDTFDTIAWLLDNVEGHNGRVGQWGISYPGFYAAAGMIDAHPALAAVSPQAPIADWFFDDFHHHGAFFLPHAFNFLSRFGVKRSGPYTDWPPRFEHGTDDGYDFFLRLGPLNNANKRHFKGEIEFWNKLVAHPNYDEFWQARNLLPHLRNVAPAVLVVGGWFDAEDLYGPLQIYREIEDNNPNAWNALVMGPWRHGGWSRGDGQQLGPIHFDAPTGTFYRENIELPFFEHHLANGPVPDLPEAYVFETGANRWRQFDNWPPAAVNSRTLYARAAGQLTPDPPRAVRGRAYDEYISDPRRPVPYTAHTNIGMRPQYMVEDQRFASRRPDVVTYQTGAFSDPLTLAGPITAHLVVSTTGTASDFVVKLIDVFPNDATMKPSPDEEPVSASGYQMMIRSEVIRARFRDGYTKPKPMTPNLPTRIDLELQSVLHTFKPGHRLMIQIQSSWFPMVDRNPQTYVPNVFKAERDDFVRATQRVWRSKTYATHFEFGVLPNAADGK